MAYSAKGSCESVFNYMTLLEGCQYTPDARMIISQISLLFTHPLARNTRLRTEKQPFGNTSIDWSGLNH